MVRIFLVWQDFRSPMEFDQDFRTGRRGFKIKVPGWEYEKKAEKEKNEKKPEKEKKENGHQPTTMASASSNNTGTAEEGTSVGLRGEWDCEEEWDYSMWAKRRVGGEWQWLWWDRLRRGGGLDKTKSKFWWEERVVGWKESGNCKAREVTWGNELLEMCKTNRWILVIFPFLSSISEAAKIHILTVISIKKVFAKWHLKKAKITDQFRPILRVSFMRDWALAHLQSHFKIQLNHESGVQIHV